VVFTLVGEHYVPLTIYPAIGKHRFPEGGSNSAVLNLDPRAVARSDSSSNCGEKARER